jgi:hypothetical protein
MSTYLKLRAARIGLFAAFVLSLPLAVTLRDTEYSFVEYIRYLPPLLLALALIVGAVERAVRVRNGLPPIRFGGASRTNRHE